MKHFFVLISLSFLALSACNRDRNESDPSDTAVNQLGDVMVGMDESGGSTGSYTSLMNGYRDVAKIEKRHSGYQVPDLLAKASAGACADEATFSSCSDNEIVRTFSDCTIGSATLEGTITFNFDDAAVDTTCRMASTGHSVTRAPSLTIQGARGGRFQVSVSGAAGQRITRSGTGEDYTFTNDGIRRVLSFNSRTLADWTTSTTSAIGLSGSARNGRVANGGTLRVFNNQNNESCDFTPVTVTWGASCNCATSGEWTFTCSNGDSGSYEITGCGQGTLTIGDSSQSVSLDQCTAL